MGGTEVGDLLLHACNELGSLLGLSDRGTDLLGGHVPRLLVVGVVGLLRDHRGDLGQRVVGVLVDAGVDGDDQIRLHRGDGFRIDLLGVVDLRLLALEQIGAHAPTAAPLVVVMPSQLRTVTGTTPSASNASWSV